MSALARERGLLVIADGKRGDIGSTAEAYAAAYLAARGEGSPLADALTVNPYLGADWLEPFARGGRRLGGLIFVLVRTSNPAAPTCRSSSSPAARGSGSAARRSSTASRRVADRWRRRRRRRDAGRVRSPGRAS